MDSFNGKIAVVTGGGTGMGRELCIQLVKEGCVVATCDVMMDNLNETKALCNEAAPDVAVTTPVRFAPIPDISATVILGVPVSPAAVPELFTAIVPAPLMVLPLGRVAP